MNIKTEAEYVSILHRIADLMDAQPNTPECAELVALTTQVELYEDLHYPI